MLTSLLIMVFLAFGLLNLVARIRRVSVASIHNVYKLSLPEAPITREVAEHKLLIVKDLPLDS